MRVEVSGNGFVLSQAQNADRVWICADDRTSLVTCTDVLNIGEALNVVVTACSVVLSNICWI